MYDPGDIRIEMDLRAGDNALSLERLGAVTFDQADVGHNAVVTHRGGRMSNTLAILAAMSISAVLVRLASRGGNGYYMNITLWVVQVLLAVAFFAHGWLMLAPPPEIAVQMNATMPRWFQLFIGVAEVLAAVGLILPGLSRIMPWLVTWAAAGIMFVMVSATIFHVARAEWSSAVITLILLAMATFVAYMRRRVLPIGARRMV